MLTWQNVLKSVMAQSRGEPYVVGQAMGVSGFSIKKSAVGKWDAVRRGEERMDCGSALYTGRTTIQVRYARYKRCFFVRIYTVQHRHDKGKSLCHFIRNIIAHAW